MSHDMIERYFPDAGRRPVAVGYDDNRHAREAVRWAAAEAARRDVPLRVVYAANYPGMTLGPGPGLLDRSPGALDAAEEVTAEGVTAALDARPGLHVTGVTEVTSPADTLVRVGAEAEPLVIGTLVDSTRHSRATTTSPTTQRPPAVFAVTSARPSPRSRNVERSNRTGPTAASPATAPGSNSWSSGTARAARTPSFVPTGHIRAEPFRVA